MAIATQTQLTPIEDRIIVKKEEAEEKTAGGILLPDNAKDKPQQGIVVAVGPGKRDDKGNLQAIDYLKEGDKIIYPKYSGTEVKVSGEEYLILRASDVLAKLG